MPSELEQPAKPVARIDFSAPPNHTFKTTIEREEFQSERLVRLVKDAAVSIAALALLGMVAWLCTRTLVTPGESEEAQRWAQSILFSLATGTVAYLIKR